MAKSASNVLALPRSTSRPKLVRDPFADLARSFERALRARNRSEHTIASYLVAMRQFAEFVKKDPTQVQRADVERWIEHLLATAAPATASNRFRSLQSFWKWMLEEAEVTESPMRMMKPPQLPESNVPVLGMDDLAALFRTVKGDSFEARRDRALLDLFVRTGARRAEIMNLRYDQDNPTDPERNDIDLEQRVMRVLGKGRRVRTVGLDAQTVRSLDRYLRVRSQHSKAHLPWLWLAFTRQGRLTANGLYQMVRRRGQRAGLGDIHPHSFRHLYTDQWLRAGGSETGLMENNGWRNPAMLRRYAGSLRQDRAIAERRRLSLFENL